MSLALFVLGAVLAVLNIVCATRIKRAASATPADHPGYARLRAKEKRLTAFSRVAVLTVGALGVLFAIAPA